MPTVGILLIALVAAVLCIEAPPKWAVTILFGTAFLVPDTLRLTGGPHWLTVYRLVLWSTTLGLVLRVSRREIPGTAFRPGRAHAILALFVVFTYFVGVDAALPPATFSQNYDIWLGIVDELFMLITVVAFARVLGVRWVATRALAVIAVSAGIGVWERFDQHSYARFWIERVDISRLGPGAPLEHRGTKVRVRGASQFALEYGWIIGAFVPLAVSVAIRSGRRLAFAVPAVLMAAVVASISRSVYIGIIAGIVVVVLVSRFDGRVLRAVLLGGLVAAGLYFGPTGLRNPYHGAPADSINSRKRRLLFVGDAALDHPYTGIGLAGLEARGITSTDDSYLLTYASLGVIGLVLLGAVLITPAAIGTAAGLQEEPDDRLIIAGVVGGMTALFISAGSYDAFQLPEANAALWILGGLAVAGASNLKARRGERARESRPSPARLLLPAAGVSLGLALGATASTGAASVSIIQALSAQQLKLGGDNSFAGQVMANTTCRAGQDEIVARGFKVEVSCTPDPAVGVANLRIGAPTAVTLNAALQAFDDGARRVNPGYTREERRRTIGQATVPRTATISGGLAGALLAVFLPLRRRRRSGRDPDPAVGLDEDLVSPVGGEVPLELVASGQAPRPPL